ncbi:MAG: hypothetical protein ACK54E_22240 [Pseudanabaena sp.]
MTIIILVNFKLFKIVRYPVKRSPLTTHKPERLFPHIKQRSHLISQPPIAYFLKIKQRSHPQHPQA